MIPRGPRAKPIVVALCFGAVLLSSCLLWNLLYLAAGTHDIEVRDTSYRYVKSRRAESAPDWWPHNVRRIHEVEELFERVAQESPPGSIKRIAIEAKRWMWLPIPVIRYNVEDRPFDPHAVIPNRVRLLQDLIDRYHHNRQRYPSTDYLAQPVDDLFHKEDLFGWKVEYSDRDAGSSYSLIIRAKYRNASYYTDQTGVLRFEPTTLAGPQSPIHSRR